MKHFFRAAFTGNIGAIGIIALALVLLWLIIWAVRVAVKQHREFQQMRRRRVAYNHKIRRTHLPGAQPAIYTGYEDQWKPSALEHDKSSK